MTTQEKQNQYIMGTYGRFPVVLEQGKQESCQDETGKQYIDFGSGIGTNSLGYCNEAWVNAVCKQAQTLQHTSNLYYTKAQADFAEALCKATGYHDLFFCNSGAEANECAIKLARKYSFDKYGKGRHKILTLVNSFHGRTMATLSATGQDVFHNYFFPFLEGFDYVVANDIADLDAKIDDTVCAILIEYVQGEGGVMALEQDFVDAIYDRCAKRDILVMTDEVQTGMGRTGTLLAGEQFGHHADVVTLAKGIAASVQEKAAYLREKLAKLPHVQAVTGLGLMVGIQLDADKKAIDVVNAALEQGLLLLTAKDRVRLLPPLTISKDELDRGVAILADVLSK